MVRHLRDIFFAVDYQLQAQVWKTLVKTLKIRPQVWVKFFWSWWSWRRVKREVRLVAIVNTLHNAPAGFSFSFVFVFAFIFVGLREGFWSFCNDHICRFLIFGLRFSACYVNSEVTETFFLCVYSWFIYLFIYGILSGTQWNINLWHWENQFVSLIGFLNSRRWGNLGVVLLL